MTITIEIPERTAEAVGLPLSELSAEIKLAAAIHWYTQSRISQGRAAMIAGMHRVDFLNVLAARKVDVFQVDFDDLDKELERARASLTRRGCEDLSRPNEIVRRSEGR
jgi:predicted HTH domain antitoxin